MIDKCLMGYPKSFIDFITTFKKDFYIDQETFESLLPDKEIILEDERKYIEYETFCKCYKSTYLDMPDSSKRCMIVFHWPISYKYTYDLLKYGMEMFEKLCDHCYRITEFYSKDGKDYKKERYFPTTFTKQEFIESTKMYKSKKLIRKK